MNDVLDARYNTERLLHEREERQKIRLAIAERECIQRGYEYKSKKRNKEVRNPL